jgi:hypothetical protein
MPIGTDDVNIVTGAAEGGGVLKDEEEDETPELRLRTSNFLVTINSNRRLKTREIMRPIVVEFYNTLERLLTDPRFYARAIDVLPLEDTYDTNVHAVITNTGVEHSLRAGLHAHSHWKIYHDSRIRIALNPLRLMLKDAFPSWTKFYVDVRFVKSGEAATIDYVFKEVRNKRMRVPSDLCSHPDFGISTIYKHEMALADKFSI